VHRDLKLDNIFLVTRNTASHVSARISDSEDALLAAMDVRVGDLGLSFDSTAEKEFEEDKSDAYGDFDTGDDDISIESLKTLQTQRGHLTYRSPEMLGLSPLSTTDAVDSTSTIGSYSYPTDLWSLGLMLCEMCTGALFTEMSHPGARRSGPIPVCAPIFRSTLDRIMNEICSSDKLDAQQSTRMATVLKGLLERNPRKRMVAKDARRLLDLIANPTRNEAAQTAKSSEQSSASSASNVIANWLRTKHPSLERYAKCMCEYGYDSIEALKDATEEDLTDAFEEMDCTIKRPHRRMIISHHKSLTTSS